MDEEQWRQLFDEHLAVVRSAVLPGDFEARSAYGKGFLDALMAAGAVDEAGRLELEAQLVMAAAAGRNVPSSEGGQS